MGRHEFHNYPSQYDPGHEVGQVRDRLNQPFKPDLTDLVNQNRQQYRCWKRKDKLQTALIERYDLDLLQKATSSGPHRDDYIFYLKDKKVADFGSRGEVRSFVLSLKLAELQFIKEKTKKAPVLLLDDVFSELDYLRQEQFLKTLFEYQTVITTTEKQLEQDWGSPVKLWKVEKAKITSI